MRRRNDDFESRGLLTASSTEYERLGALEALRAASAQAYDPERPEHVRAIKDLWATAFPGETFALPSARWKDLGFQGTDPRTDLRGAGFLGLTQLQALLTQHGSGLLGLEDDLPPELSGLPLAIASINCTAMLLSHLQLAPKLTTAFTPGGRSECSAETLHAFLSLGWEGGGGGADGGADGDRAQLSPPRAPLRPSSAALPTDASEEAAAVRRLLFALVAMHGQLVVHLGRTWRRMCAEPSTTLMDFPAALRETYAHLQRALRAAGGAPWRLETISTHLDNEAAAPLLLDGFGPLSEAVVDYSSWALSSAVHVVSYAWYGLVGMCFSAPPEAVHDKRS